MKRHQLNEIEKRYQGDVKRCKNELLSCWLNNTTTPTWEAIVVALCLMEAHTAADVIQKKFITSSITNEGIALLHSW